MYKLKHPTVSVPPRLLFLGLAALAPIVFLQQSTSNEAAQIQRQMPPLVQPISLEEPDACLAYGAAVARRDGRTGNVRFIGTEPGAFISTPNSVPAGATPETAARAYLSACGRLFGLSDQSTELAVVRASITAGGRSVVRMQQLHQGIPILGAELIVNLDDAKNILSVSGKTIPSLNLGTTPAIAPTSAADVALSIVAKSHAVDPLSLAASKPEQWIYEPTLLGPGEGPPRLVWRMEVTPVDLLPIRELVLVDALRGSVALHFNQVETALYRATYTAFNGKVLPGTLVCNESNPACAGGDAHAVAAHVYAADAYNFYMTHHGRDSIDGAGLTLTSTVHYDVNYANASWLGAPRNQMLYGDALGFALADDVVAHELTHGVTQFTSNLFYYYQSGAINESLSDIWGEFVDQTNGRGLDLDSVRWWMGEDIQGLGAIRNMQHPPAYGDPDKMTSPLYHFAAADNGGVHINSGINNKAAYLMTDGGVFNGVTVAGIGLNKVAKIYYEVQTHLLTSGADYGDLYDALYQGCNNLVGTHGIGSGDCQQVRNATDAVEMNRQPVANFNTDAAVCAVGQRPSTVFFDDLEAGPENFITNTLTGTVRWSYGSPYGPYAYSGKNFLYADDVSNVNRTSESNITDSAVLTQNGIVLPPNAFLHFAHAFGFEAPNWDGGVVEYSTNGGTTWNDAGGLFEVNGYSGAVASGYQNPIAGRTAFLGDSHGYISSRLNLSSLAGQTTSFRWRMGLDTSGYNWGWWLDDVHIYTCLTPSLVQVVPNTARQGQSNLNVSLTGQFTQFTQGLTTVDFGASIVVNNVSVLDSTHATANVTVAADAVPGARSIRVTSGSEVVLAANAFAVLSATPTVTGIAPFTGIQGTSFAATIMGANLNGASAVSFDGTGVSAVIGANGTQTTLPVTITIVPDAVVGRRSLTVTATNGTSVAVAAFTVLAPGDSISTVAGTDSEGSSGDGGSATLASLNSPRGLAVDAQGHLFIADSSNNRILRVDASTGLMTTVAGTGVHGGAGDGGPATSAELRSPHAVAVDGDGNLYIADYLNHRIRKVNASNGIITTIAGDGTFGSSGDGGPAVLARLNRPQGVAVNSAGDVFIADDGRRIRKVAAADGMISTVAGTAEGGSTADGIPATDANIGLSTALALDSTGNLYIASYGNDKIRRVSAADGTITTIAGSGTHGFSGDLGPATSAQLADPRGIAVDLAGNIFIADFVNSRIRKVIASTGIIVTVAGSGQAGFSGDGGPAVQAELNFPYGIAVDGVGRLYIADQRNDRVRRVAPPIEGPDITTAKSHTGAFVQGQSDALYTIAVANVGALASTGVITVTDVLPPELSYVSAIGDGWNVESTDPVTLVRVDSLQPGETSSIALTVNVALNAPGMLTNTVSVQGGGDVNAANNTTSDSASIIPLPAISGIEPSAAPAGSTRAAVLTGTDLASATAVTVSGTGVLATIEAGGSATSIPISVAIAPDAPLGVRTLTVTTPAGTSAPFSGFVVNGPDPPSIREVVSDPSGLSQAVAPYYGAGFELTVRGSSFLPGAVVSVNDGAAATTFVDATALTAMVPASVLESIGALQVRVTNPNTDVSSVVVLKTVERGDISGDRSVSIGDALVCALTVGGLARPALPLSVGDVTLNGAANIGDCLVMALFTGRVLTNMPTPQVSSTSPAPAVSGEMLTISGTGFSATPVHNTVLFTTSSGVNRVTPSASTTTNLTVIVPDDAVSGPIQVHRSDMPMGGHEYPLVIAGTPIQLLLTSVAPAVAARGSSIILHGSGFSETSGLNLVRFKTAAGTTSGVVTAASADSLTVIVPDDVVCGAVSVEINGFSTAGRTVVISETSCSVQLSAVIGSAAPGEVLVLEGAGFNVAVPANNVVQFEAAGGGTVQAPVVQAGGTQLHVRVPDTAVQGDITVTVGNTTSNAIPYAP